MLRKLLSKVGNKNKYLNKSQEIASLIWTGQRTTLGVGPIFHLVGDSLFVQHCNACRLLAQGFQGPSCLCPPLALRGYACYCARLLWILGGLSLALYTCMTITVLTSHLFSPCILWIPLSLCWHIWAMLAFSVRRFSLSFASKLNDTLCQKLLSVLPSTMTERLSHAWPSLALYILVFHTVASFSPLLHLVHLSWEVLEWRG